VITIERRPPATAGDAFFMAAAMALRCPAVFAGWRGSRDAS
jgi:hypothetical protein